MRVLLLALALLSLAGQASAHRLDEYLLAATILLGKDKIVLQLRLTPGVAVAPRVLAEIGDQGAYAARISGQMVLALDGNAVQPRLVSSAFPAGEDLLKGTGEIAFTFEAPMPAGRAAHRLTFENHVDTDIAVYLVNCLVPRDPDIRIAGQERSYDQSVYRLDFALDGVPAAAPDSDRPGEPGLIATFFRHGVRHILTGYDHLLFVAALVLGAATLWDLVKVVTLFTIAHSITLTLAALGLAHLPESLVECLISASIVFVAVQNLLWPDRAKGYGRLAAAFSFGLFHGLGFAGGLIEVLHQMPPDRILLAILGFSLGVEAGNQLVLLPLFGALRAVPRSQMIWRRVGSAGVSAGGLYYLGAALLAAI